MAQVQGLTQNELASLVGGFKNYGDMSAMTKGLEGIAVGLREAGTVNRQEAINKLMQNPPSLPAIKDTNGNVVVDEDVDYSKLSEMIRPYDATLAMKYAEEGKKVDELRRKAELNLRVAGAGKDIGKDYATKKAEYESTIKSNADEIAMIEQELTERKSIGGRQLVGAEEYIPGQVSSDFKFDLKPNDFTVGQPAENLTNKYGVLNTMNFGQSPQKFNR